MKLLNLSFSERGKSNSKYPNRFKVNKNIITVIKIKNSFILKMESPTHLISQETFKKITNNPRNKKEKIIPRTIFNDDNLIFFLFCCIIEEKESNLIEIIGRTQGIKLSIKPPINAIK
jgi:hypothetical protein